MYKKIVTKGCPDHCYLRIRLDFEDGVNPEIDAVKFKSVILEAVSSLFGLAVSSSLIDILQYEQQTRSAILRITHNNLEKIWSSLTMYGNCNGITCAFRILQVSPHLMALAGNSRSVAIEVLDD